MTAASRRVGMLGAGLAFALAVAFAISGFDDHLATGVRSGSRVTLQNRRGAPPRPATGACENLTTGVRRAAAPIAFAANGSLVALDLGRCDARTLVAGGVTGPVRFSADRRWIAYGAATVISDNGGQIERPLGPAVSAGPHEWAWSPAGTTLAGITRSGSILTGAPGRLPRRLEPADWGATQIMFSGPRTLVAVRGASLWSISLGSGAARQIYVADNPGAELQLALVHDGAIVFWQLPLVSASVASDGVPLFALVPGQPSIPLASSVIIAPEAVAPCGHGLAVMLGAGRDLTKGKQIVVYSADWRPRLLGEGIAPSCSADGRLVAFARGPAEPGLSFGDERRRIYVVSGRGGPQALSTAPPDGVSNEFPVVAADGQAVTWVRTTGPAGGAAGNPQPYVGQLRVAPVSGPVQPGTPITALGGTDDFYGRLGWADTMAFS